jgi:hypothetical protein
LIDELLPPLLRFPLFREPMLDQSYFFRSGGYPYFRKQPNSRLRPEKGLRQAPASRPHLLRLSEFLGVTQPLKEEVAVWGATQKSVTPASKRVIKKAPMPLLRICKSAFSHDEYGDPVLVSSKFVEQEEDRRAKKKARLGDRL